MKIKSLIYLSTLLTAGIFSSCGSDKKIEPVNDYVILRNMPVDDKEWNKLYSKFDYNDVFPPSYDTSSVHIKMLFSEYPAKGNYVLTNLDVNNDGKDELFIYVLPQNNKGFKDTRYNAIAKTSEGKDTTLTGLVLINSKEISYTNKTGIVNLPNTKNLPSYTY